MRTAASLCLVALCCFSYASAYFWVGEKDGDSDLVAVASLHLKFDGDKPKVLHINTCNQSGFIMDMAEISTFHGKTIKAELLKGGQGFFSALLKVESQGEVSIRVQVWGKWVHEQEKYKNVECEKVFQVFDHAYPCAD